MVNRIVGKIDKNYHSLYNVCHAIIKYKDQLYFNGIINQECIHLSGKKHYESI